MDSSKNDDRCLVERALFDEALCARGNAFLYWCDGSPVHHRKLRWEAYNLYILTKTIFRSEENMGETVTFIVTLPNS